jgi:hypothetical protein
MENKEPIIYTKQSLVEELLKIKARGFVPNARHGNHGGIGNTLEDLLGIEENNLPLPNAAEWELKTQRIGTSSLTTLFHTEPSPRAIKFVPAVLLLKYGWRHQEAGAKYPENEMSFRQTIHGVESNRGFKVVVDEAEQKVKISFNHNLVADEHAEWKKFVEAGVGLSELAPQPYWGFEDLAAKAKTKLNNCFYVQAEVKRNKETKEESYHYKVIQKLTGFNFDGFLDGLREGFVLVDFDARTGHNHGTKFRLRQNFLPRLYKNVKTINSVEDLKEENPTQPIELNVEPMPEN